MKKNVKIKRSLSIAVVAIISLVILNIISCTTPIVRDDVSSDIATNPYLKRTYKLKAVYKTVRKLHCIYRIKEDRCEIDDFKVSLPVNAKVERFMFPKGTRFKILRLEAVSLGGGDYFDYVSPYVVLLDGKYKGKELWVSGISKRYWGGPLKLHVPDPENVVMVK